MKKMKLSMWLILLFATVFSTQAQVTEGFEGGTFPPTDWTQLGPSQWVRTTNYLYVNSGSAAAKCSMMYMAPMTSILVSPKVVPNATNNVFKFHIRKFDGFTSSETVKIKISTTDNLESSFTTTAYTKTSAELSDVYVEHTVDLSAYQGQSIYIAIVYEADGSNNIYIDDITMPNLFTSSCAKPSSVATTFINSTSATIGWDGEAVANYNVDYRIAGTTVWTSTTTASNSITLSSLVASTAYQFRVQKNCGTEVSDWSNILTFNTPCDAITTFPFVEEFNGTALPSCWFESKTQASTFGWDSTAIGHSGNGFQFDSYNNLNGNTSMLRTPVLNVSSLATSQLGFWWKNPTGGNFKVVLSTDGGSTFPNVLQDNMISQAEWDYKILDITSYIATGSNVVIGFQATSNWGSGNAYVYIDSVNVTAGLPANDILTFNLATPAVTGTVNATAHTVALTVPYGTDVTALVPTFTLSAYASAKVGTVAQVSGTTANDFTSPVTYTVTAQDVSTQDWVVTVTVAPISTAKDILTFNLATPSVTGTVNATAHTVALTVPYGTDVTALVPTFTLSSYASVKVGTADQVSGTTANDFTTPVTYTVTAQDASTQDWIVTVNVASLSAEKDILTFYLPSPLATGIVNTTAHTVALSLPFGTNVTALVPTFTLSSYASAKVGTVAQVSGTTANNFTNPVTYTVTAEDGSTQDWVVTVTVAAVQTYTVTFNVIGGNGTLAATVDAAAITSPATVEAGKNVIFTATPATGYVVKEWTFLNISVDGNTTNDYAINNIGMNASVAVQFELANSISDASESVAEIYPNPANNVVNVKMNTIINKVAVVNMNGQTVVESRINNNEGSINTSSITTGMYFLRIETANGITMKKIQITK